PFGTRRGPPPSASRCAGSRTGRRAPAPRPATHRTQPCPQEGGPASRGAPEGPPRNDDDSRCATSPAGGIVTSTAKQHVQGVDMTDRADAPRTATIELAKGGSFQI